MLLELRVANCFAYNEEVIFSLQADMRSKKFSTNVHNIGSFNVVKAAGIYGQNNAGKTCLLKCITALKKILLNKKTFLMSNIFTVDDICKIGVSFLEDGREFSYDFHFNTKTKSYTYEKFAEIKKDTYGNISTDVWLLKDSENKTYMAVDEKLQDVMQVASQDNLLCYLIDNEQFPHLAEMKKNLRNFADKIEVVNMNNIPLKRTISFLKNHGDMQKKIVSFIKSADLYLDDFRYVSDDDIEVDENMDNVRPEEHALNIPEELLEQIRLVSVYKGRPVPSMIFDSTGTKKIAALAGYVIEALEKGRILVVDELDSSLHFKITRAIVTLFNNELNDNSQLIFTIHDINLMDCKRLFRKEQIWFIHKDLQRVYLYSLSDYTAKMGVRDTSDIVNKYQKGIMGAIPEPDLIKTLLEIKKEGRVDSE